MQLPLGAEPLKEQDQLQLEEDHRVDGGSPDVRVGITHQVAHEAQVERAFQMAIEVIWRNQIFKRDGGQRTKRRSFVPIIAGRSFRQAGQQRERHPLIRQAPFSTRWNVFGPARPHRARADSAGSRSSRRPPTMRRAWRRGWRRLVGGGRRDGLGSGQTRAGGSGHCAGVAGMTLLTGGSG